MQISLKHDIHPCVYCRLGKISWFWSLFLKKRYHQATLLLPWPQRLMAKRPAMSSALREEAAPQHCQRASVPPHWIYMSDNGTNLQAHITFPIFFFTTGESCNVENIFFFYLFLSCIENASWSTLVKTKFLLKKNCCCCCCCCSSLSFPYVVRPLEFCGECCQEVQHLDAHMLLIFKIATRKRRQRPESVPFGQGGGGASAHSTRAVS